MMTILPRRRCWLLICGWCFIVWGMTYIAPWSQSEREWEITYAMSGGATSSLPSQPKKAATLTEHNKIRYMNSTVIQEEMSNRRAQIRRYCDQQHIKRSTKASPFSREYLKRIMINRDKKIMFCYIPKIANTNFRRLFLHVKGLVRKEEVAQITGYEIYTKYARQFLYLDKIGNRERQKLLKEYTKILFVREPLERLLSAYRNKFFHPNAKNREEFIEYYLAFFEKHPNILATRGKLRTNFNEQPLTFREFLIYWTDALDTGSYINEHFVPTFELSNPCEVQYDYIGKYETLHKDVRFIFQNLGIDIEFPRRNDNYTASQTVDLVESYYKEIPNRLFKKAWAYLRTDSNLFGYSLPKWALQKLY